MSVTHPAATGGAGVDFETKVAAACLTLLLTRGSALCLGTGTLNAVHLQAGHLGEGWDTDDLLLEATDAGGGPMKAALQVKRTFSLSASNSECINMLHGALTDFRNSAQFDKQRDVVALITSSLSTRLARGLRTLLDCARASLTADDMERRLTIPNYLGKPALEYHNVIVEILTDAVGGAPTNEELWQFLRRFHVIDFDLESTNGITETMLRALLSATLPDGDPTAVDATWNELVMLALSGAGKAMSYTREKLPHTLLQRHGRATEYSRGISRLLEDSAIVINGIQTSIAGKATLPRRELTGKLCRLVETSPLIFVTGAAGSGKSALVKSVFSIATQNGIGFVFRADSLAGSHINDVLSQRGLALSGLQAQTAMHTKKLFWVESLERLMEKPPAQRTAFLDLLRKLKMDPSWRLIVTCRDYSAETVRTAFFSEVGMSPADIEVGELGNDELDDVVVDLPSLKRPLSNPSLRHLLRNPFFLDKAAKMNWPASELLPTTEREFRKKVWSEVIRRGDEDMERGLPALREQALIEIALRRAKALTPFVSANNFDTCAVFRLVRDSLLQTSTSGDDLYAPAHDVFEDWALMQWLDGIFDRHNHELDSLLGEIAPYPALRRAYRRWLTEVLDVDPQIMDSQVVALMKNPTVTAHWREDTLVGILQSGNARNFTVRNTKLLLADDAKLFRQVVHILRVACRVALPQRLFGVDSDGEFFLPKGDGWIGIGQLMETALPFLTKDDLLMIIGFLEEWILFTKCGWQYPPGAKSIAKIAWYWLPKISSHCPVCDAEDRLLWVILAIPRAAEPTLTEEVERALENRSYEYFDRNLLNLIFNHFACDAIVRDLPDLAFRVAEHLLGLDQSLEDAIARDRNGYWSHEVEHTFGFGRRHSMEDYPASAFHGPYLRMLWHHPNRGLDFLIRMINRAGDAYSHSKNQSDYVEPSEVVTIHLPGGLHELHFSWPLYSAYRGMDIAPCCFKSALMALEYWLLEKARRDDTDLEPLLLELLRRANNVSVAAIVASIAAAKPLLAGEAAFALLTCRALLQADYKRLAKESFIPKFQSYTKNAPYDKERKASAALDHRNSNLRCVAVNLQMTKKFKDRVWKLIDAYKAELPAESEQDKEMKIWRIQLHHLDTRNFSETGRTADGHIVIESNAPESDLQVLIEEQKPRFAAFENALSLINWGMAVFEGRIVGNDWEEYLEKAQTFLESKEMIACERELVAGGPVYIASVCIRDSWDAMSHEQQQWCAQIVCDTIDAEKDIIEQPSVYDHNSMAGSRPAAFAISALFDKTLNQETQGRLLPMLAKVVMNAVGEIVTYAMQGVGQFLWTSDRALALTCIHALVTYAKDRHAFREQQRRRPFNEQEPEKQFFHALRLRLREFILHREVADEVQLGTLNCALEPGRMIATHLFRIIIENPDDLLLRQIIHYNAALLPEIWKNNNQRWQSRHGTNGNEMRFDPEIEHVFVDAICRFAVQIQPDDALTLLEPVFINALEFPEDAADVVDWLILHQGDRVPALTMWTLWQRFADDFVEVVSPDLLNQKYSDWAKMLRKLFLGVICTQQHDWPPLHGETHRIDKLFLRLPPMAKVFDCYAHYLAKLGSSTLPDALVAVATKICEGGAHMYLNGNAGFYLEEILTRLIHSGNSRIRTEAVLRQATLTILDALVTAGSSLAYKLRDDFLTPFSG